MKTAWKKSRIVFALGAVVAVLIIFCSVLALQTVAFRQAIETLAEKDIRNRTDLVVQVLKGPLASGNREEVFRICEAEAAKGARVTLILTSGQVLYDTSKATGDHRDREEIIRARDHETGWGIRRSETLGTYQLYCAWRIDDVIVRLAVPYAEVIEPVRLAKRGFYVAGLFGACAVGLLFFLMKRLMGRLESQAAELAVTKAAEAYRREFTAHVSHELKTPLTAIVGAVEMLDSADESLSAAERKELREIIQAQAGRLGHLVHDVLALAHLEANSSSAREKFTKVNLNDLIRDVLRQEEPLAKRAGTALTFFEKSKLEIEGDAHLITQALENVIENAFRYSGADQIEISLKRVAQEAIVEIKDYGIGIPPEHLPHLFERFYRVDKARSRSLGGTGLGLAIVKHIVQLHGGRVSVSSQQGLQTTFSLSFPCV